MRPLCSTGKALDAATSPGGAVMTDERAKLRFRFGIRSMLIVVSLLAVLLALGPRVFEWYYSVPLSELVDGFNARYSGHLTNGLAITEGEVIKAIERKIAISWAQST